MRCPGCFVALPYGVTCVTMRGMSSPLGVLLANIGTPDAPTAAAVRRYLREFLSDRRVVDLPRALWLPILHGFVLTFRPRRVARLYKGIWTSEGSPLLRIMRQQATALENVLRERSRRDVRVRVGMSYGNPSMRRALEALREEGCRRLVVLPMFPQHSSSTTGSTFDAVARVLKRWPKLPELQFIRDYHHREGYIAALSASVREVWQRDGEPELLLISFHGIPKRYAAAGDPYPQQCEHTATLLRQALGLGVDRCSASFQSRFGPEPWLQPYTDVTLREWARSGVRRVDVVCPGFSADCLETLEEIDVQNRAFFLSSGGERFRYISALNARDDHVAALSDLVLDKLRAWDD